MRRKRPGPDESNPRPQRGASLPTLRIIGGTMGGRKLLYSGDERTRPMKDRVREAVFNLVGTDVHGKQVLDLFAGSGALGFEALSRGAASAKFIEQHFPTAALIRQNAALLEVTDKADVHAGSAFAWAVQHRLPPEPPWLVFCSPPYALYIDRRAEMLSLIESLITSAPATSVFVVETDKRFEVAHLPQPDRWDIREYPPAVVAILRT